MANILVVDDAGVIRHKLKNELTAEGFDVFTARNAGMVYNDSFSPDLSLEDMDIAMLDIYLKDENGLKVLEHIKDVYPSISVMMISVETEKDTVRKSIYLGAEDYLVKPFDKEEMLGRINRLLSEEDAGREPSVKKRTVSRSNALEKLNTSLSMEINRAIRSEMSFTLMKIIFPEEIREEEMRAIRDNITGKIRDIDRVFFLGENAYAFLLPLTDMEGRDVFLEKIETIIEENASLKKENLETESVTFPDDAIDGDNVEPEDRDRYKDNLLDTILEISL